VKALVRKTVGEMAEEIYRRGIDASGPELSDLVTEVMKSGGYDPQDGDVRREIGKLFKSFSGRAQ
jgi:hypothetical protein